MTRLDSLCKTRGYLGPYLLKADVQGAELRVLEGAIGILESTEVVILEVSLFKTFIDGPVFDEIINFMKQKSFCLYDLFGGIHRPLDKALAQFDAVFVKEHGKFRQDHRFSDKIS